MKEFILENCFKDKIKLEIDINKVKYIFRQVISSDEVFIVVYKNGEVLTFDSDTHCRFQDFNEDLQMIYPEEIQLDTGKFYSPGKIDCFYLIQKG